MADVTNEVCLLSYCAWVAVVSDAYRCLPVPNNVGTHSQLSTLRQIVDDPKQSFILSLGKFAKINPKMQKKKNWSL